MRTDAELVNAVLDGEKQAFAVLVKRYERPARAVALDVLGDHHLAKDVTQDPLVRAYERLAGLRRHEAFGGWLMKIAARRRIGVGPNQSRLPASGSRSNSGLLSSKRVAR